MTTTVEMQRRNRQVMIYLHMARHIRCRAEGEDALMMARRIEDGVFGPAIKFEPLTGQWTSADEQHKGKGLFSACRFMGLDLTLLTDAITATERVGA